MINPLTPPSQPIPLTDIELCAWIGQAAPGERLEYHRGFLSVDMAPAYLVPDLTDRRRIEALARAAYRACDAGLVHLVQVRLGPHRFAYIAVARPRPKPRRSSLREQPLLAAE